MGGVEQLGLGEGGGGELQPDRELGAPAGGLATPEGIEIAGIPASDIGTVK